jgi:2'-5' RNA ligase
MAQLSAASARFFVALLPPPALRAEITAIQHDIWQRFQSKAALRSPPHITLQPPFIWPLDQVAHLERSLAAFAQQQSPVPIDLEGYGAFPPRVIYVNVQRQGPLMALQPALMDYLETHWAIAHPPSRQRPFAPHITVGFRDLKPAAFKIAWAEFKDQPFKADFVVQALTLLRHDGQTWQIFSEFPLNGSNPHST